jgi:hypothetical protein
MTRANVDYCLRADVTDLIHDMLELNNLSMELQFQGENLLFYRFWLKSAISYALVIEATLTKERPLDLTEYQYNCNQEELKELTQRVLTNLTRTIEVYKDTTYLELLAAVMFSLTMAKSYAN